jgi:hypothetical protein
MSLPLRDDEHGSVPAALPAYDGGRFLSMLLY